MQNKADFPSLEQADEILRQIKGQKTLLSIVEKGEKLREALSSALAAIEASISAVNKSEIALRVVYEVATRYGVVVWYNLVSAAMGENKCTRAIPLDDFDRFFDVFHSYVCNAPIYTYGSEYVLFEFKFDSGEKVSLSASKSEISAPILTECSSSRTALLALALQRYTLSVCKQYVGDFIDSRIVPKTVHVVPIKEALLGRPKTSGIYYAADVAQPAKAAEKLLQWMHKNTRGILDTNSIVYIENLEYLTASRVDAALRNGINCISWMRDCVVVYGSTVVCYEYPDIETLEDLYTVRLMLLIIEYALKNVRLEQGKLKHLIHNWLEDVVHCYGYEVSGVDVAVSSEKVSIITRANFSPIPKKTMEARIEVDLLAQTWASSHDMEKLAELF